MDKEHTTAKQRWMTAYQETYNNELPMCRVCWDTATYFYNPGHKAVDAARRAANTRRGEIQAAAMVTFS